MTSPSSHATLRDGDLAANLRYLCSYYRSMSEVCRRIGINRQQFNKYVAGDARPSNRNMRRICDFFGVEEFEILAPHASLLKIIQFRGLPPVRADETSLAGSLKRWVGQSDPLIRKYYGYYYSYYYSFSVPGKILKALVCIDERDGVPGYKRVERLIDREAPDGSCFVYKYQGLAFYLRERIFLIDRECLTGNEISQSVLYPSYKNRVSLLPGLILGTAGLMTREPICSRILLEYLGVSADPKALLRQCGLYDPQSPTLDQTIVAAIRNTIPDHDSALRAKPQ